MKCMWCMELQSQGNWYNFLSTRYTTFCHTVHTEKQTVQQSCPHKQKTNTSNVWPCFTIMWIILAASDWNTTNSNQYLTQCQIQVHCCMTNFSVSNNCWIIKHNRIQRNSGNQNTKTFKTKNNKHIFHC